jgi:hypothetical protein
MGAMLRVLAVTACAWALAGCGNVCHRAQKVYLTLEDKAAPCDRDGEVRSNFSYDRCEAALPRCSSADQELYHEFLDCLEGVPACRPGQELTFAAAQFGCLQPYFSITVGCRQALE